MKNDKSFIKIQFKKNIYIFFLFIFIFIYFFYVRICVQVM